MKTLRKEAGWPQGELAAKVGSGARRVSRHEHWAHHPQPRHRHAHRGGPQRLLGPPRLRRRARRRVHAPGIILGDRLVGVAELADEDAAALRNVINGFIAKSRIRTLACAG